jgi:hypothetical protein
MCLLITEINLTVKIYALEHLSVTVLPQRNVAVQIISNGLEAKAINL